MYSEWTPDDGQRHCPKHVEFHAKNKFAKLEYLVGLIVKKFVTMYGHMNLKYVTPSFVIYLHVEAVFTLYRALKSHVQRERSKCYTDQDLRVVSTYGIIEPRTPKLHISSRPWKVEDANI